ncbi:MAG: hypothetical protein QG597_2847 [Actinomycetota bacterium]|nr:hypothetical protein [Actinomycetota bacterium]
MTIAHEVVTLTVDRDYFLGVLESLLGQGYSPALVAGHCAGDSIRITYALVRARDGARMEVNLTTAAEGGTFPSAAHLNYPIGRFEREIRDLYGVTPVGHPMPYRLVRHSHWPRGWYPMAADSSQIQPFDDVAGAYPFTPVEGDGVYEIPVGPVHAGLIEPGHFRFSVVGETILRMKARLWFLHRGVERLFVGRRPAGGLELTERISGDTAVGHSLAYALAVEEALGLAVPQEAQLTRAMLLELERVYNHVGDLGAMANDVGFSFVNAHALRLREDLLRLNQRVTGHRLLRGGISIGGAAVRDLPERAQLVGIAAEVDELVAITLGNSTVRDRFTGTAVLHRGSAEEIGTLGYVARASGVSRDARHDHPFCELPESFTVTTEEGGDVLARYRVRVGEIDVSLRMIAELSTVLSAGDRQAAGGPAAALALPSAGPGHGLGLVEGWRGRLAHRVELASDGTLARVKVVDPSFFNWPALSVALADTIVPDFPLANKSFNQSYAGNDL